MSDGPMDEEKQRSRSCLGRGCLIFLLLMLAFVSFVAWGAYTFFTQAYELTDGEPGSIPAFKADSHKAAQFLRSLETRLSQWQAGRPGELLVRDEDLNHLVQSALGEQPELGEFYFRLRDGQIEVQMVLPLSNYPFLSGRYFNGTAAFRPTVEAGIFDLELERIESRDGSRVAPPQVLEAIRSQNLSSWLEEWGFRPGLDTVDEIEIDEGQLILRKKK